MTGEPERPVSPSRLPISEIWPHRSAADLRFLAMVESTLLRASSGAESRCRLVVMVSTRHDQQLPTARPSSLLAVIPQLPPHRPVESGRQLRRALSLRLPPRSQESHTA